MKNLKTISLFVALLLLFPRPGVAQRKKESTKEEKFVFTEIARVPTTPVKNQQRTGTCWSFATTSFIETELLRTGQPAHDLSEMYFARHAYIEKANLYVRYQGMANFGPGGQAHDVMNVAGAYGFVPEKVYDGKNYGSENHNHGEMGAILKGFLDGMLKGRRGDLTPVWPEAFRKVVDTYLGECPQYFFREGKTYTPLSFMESTGFNPDDYIELTSYTHHPFYTKIRLEVPDNWSGDMYYNLPMEEMMEVINHALMSGYSVAWDGDMSEGSFSHKNSIAIIPLKAWEDKTEQEREKSYKSPEPEKEITQAMRQVSFDNFSTTDDHLMHLTGIVKDQNGTRYYITKNSWGPESNETGGYLNMSEAYVKLKTIAIMVHKDAVPEGIREKMYGR